MKTTSYQTKNHSHHDTIEIMIYQLHKWFLLNKIYLTDWYTKYEVYKLTNISKYKVY